MSSATTWVGRDPRRNAGDIDRGTCMRDGDRSPVERRSARPIGNANGWQSTADRCALTIIVVTWNSAGVIGGLLDSLSIGTAGGPDWHLVVVDNASQDTTIEIVHQAEIPATVLQMGRNAGYAAAINAATRAHPSSRAYLILNPDVRLGPRTTEVLWDSLCRPGVGVSVPRLVDENGSTQLSLRRDPTVLRAMGEAMLGGHRAGRFPALGEIVGDLRAYNDIRNVDWATGAVMMVSAECARRTGEWAEEFFLYSEETDFLLRARDEGFLVQYNPNVDVVHIGGESFVSPQLYSLLTTNKVRFYQKRHGRVRSVLFKCVITLNEILRIRRTVSRAALRALLRPNPRS